MKKLNGLKQIGLFIVTFLFVGSFYEVKAYDKNIQFSDDIYMDYVESDSNKYITTYNSLKNDNAKVYFQSVKKAKEEWDSINKTTLELNDLYSKKEVIDRGMSGPQQAVNRKQEEVASKTSEVNALVNAAAGLNITSINTTIEEKTNRKSQLEADLPGVINDITNENLARLKRNLYNCNKYKQLIASQMENATDSSFTALETLRDNIGRDCEEIQNDIASLEGNISGEAESITGDNKILKYLEWDYGSCSKYKQLVISQMENETGSSLTTLETLKDNIGTNCNEIKVKSDEIKAIISELTTLNAQKKLLEEILPTAQQELATLQSQLATLTVERDTYINSVNTDIDTKETKLRSLLDFSNNKWKQLSLYKQTLNTNRYKVDVPSDSGYYVDWIRVDLDGKSYYSSSRYVINSTGEIKSVTDSNTSENIKESVEETIKTVSNNKHLNYNDKEISIFINKKETKLHLIIENKKLKALINNKEISIKGLSGNVKSFTYAKDCAGNLTILVLTEDAKLYASTIPNDEQLAEITFKDVKLDNGVTISDITRYDIDDYYKKLNISRTCNSQNLAAILSDGSIRALEFDKDGNYYLNMSVKLIEETSVKEELIENPKTGIKSYYLVGILFILISFVGYNILKTKHILN